jgi:hypothetical protein
MITHMIKEWADVDPNPDGGTEIHHRLIRIDNGKNSAGTNGRQVTVRVSWKYRVIKRKRFDGKVVPTQYQLTTWHWEEGIAPLLSAWKKGSSAHKSDAGSLSKAEQRRIKLDAVLHFRDAPGGRYYSKTLGIPKEKPVTAERFGRLLCRREDIMDSLRAMFGINDGYVWDSTKDYNVVRRQLSKYAQVQGAAELDKLGDALTNNRFDEDIMEGDELDSDGELVPTHDIDITQLTLDSTEEAFDVDALLRDAEEYGDNEEDADDRYA